MSDIGKRMAALREDRDLSQRQFAKQMHLSPSSVSNYETGHRVPSLDFLCRVADFYGVSTDYLLGRTSTTIPISYLLSNVSGNTSVELFLEKLLDLDPARKKRMVETLKDLHLCKKIEEKR